MTLKPFSPDKFHVPSGYPQAKLGRCALLFSVIISAVAVVLSLLITVAGAPKSAANSPPYVIPMVVVAIFPTLEFLGSIGYLAAVYLWLVPAIVHLHRSGPRAALLRGAAPAVIICTVFSTILAVFGSLFPPQVLGGDPHSLFRGPLVGFLEWTSNFLAVPITWWVWSAVRVVSRNNELRWRQAAFILSWAWPTVLAGELLTGIGQRCLLHLYRSGGSAHSWPVRISRILTAIFSLWMVISIALAIISTLLLVAIRLPGGEQIPPAGIADAP